MAYCTPSDIVGLAPQLTLDASSKPSSGQVVAMIGDIEQEVDAILGQLGYVVPVTAPASLTILRNKVGHGVLAQVLRARAYGTADPKAHGAEAAETVYRGFLKALANGTDPMILPDAAVTSKAVEKDPGDLQSTASSGAYDPSYAAPVSATTVY